MNLNFKEGDRITCKGGTDSFDCKATIIKVLDGEINVKRDDGNPGAGFLMEDGYETWRLIKKDYKHIKIVSRKNEWKGAKRGSFST